MLKAPQVLWWPSWGALCCCRVLLRTPSLWRVSEWNGGEQTQNLW
ncbi:hypothetical protein NFI96_025819 [Prochilodus magdalenae]|nr:hypothetical protein NFI96_025819 [Prochilodus magdalenae]